METKRIREYLSIMLNGKMRTVLIERKRMIFDGTNIKVGDTEKWIEYMCKLMMNLFETEKWSYLGDEDSFFPENKEKVLRVVID